MGDILAPLKFYQTLYPGENLIFQDCDDTRGQYLVFFPIARPFRLNNLRKKLPAYCFELAFEEPVVSPVYEITTLKLNISNKVLYSYIRV